MAPAKRTTYGCGIEACSSRTCVCDGGTAGWRAGRCSVAVSGRRRRRSNESAASTGGALSGLRAQQCRRRDGTASWLARRHFPFAERTA
jgi:hypothetical protein